MKRYYLLAALALVPLLVAGGVLYQSLDRRVGDLEPRVIRIEGEQIAQAERLKTVVERTETVAEPVVTERIVREEARAVSAPSPKPAPAPRPKPAPGPSAPEATTPPLPRLLEPTSRPCNEIKNDQKRHKCRQRRKEARRERSQG